MLNADRWMNHPFLAPIGLAAALAAPAVAVAPGILRGARAEERRASDARQRHAGDA
jgi:hypothetical protein